MGKGDRAQTTRRDFLKLAATGAPAAAVAVAAGGEVAEAGEGPAALGLRKTDHVKAYLETARF